MKASTHIYKTSRTNHKPFRARGHIHKSICVMCLSVLYVYTNLAVQIYRIHHRRSRNPFSFLLAEPSNVRIVNKASSSPLHGQCLHEDACSKSHAQLKGVNQSLNTLAVRMVVLAGPNSAMAKKLS